ncbi:MAG: hypothetical protein LBQ66_11510 [Planctomycetaceae bacterium]|nr:hypothetical protein [Planctomycetaceae bacterium]
MPHQRDEDVLTFLVYLLAFALSGRGLFGAIFHRALPCAMGFLPRWGVVGFGDACFAPLFSACFAHRGNVRGRPHGSRLSTLRSPTRFGVQFQLVWFYYAQRRAGCPRSSPSPLRGYCRLRRRCVIWFCRCVFRSRCRRVRRRNRPAVGCPPYVVGYPPYVVGCPPLCCRLPTLRYQCVSRSIGTRASLAPTIPNSTASLDPTIPNSTTSLDPTIPNSTASPDPTIPNSTASLTLTMPTLLTLFCLINYLCFRFLLFRLMA